MKRTSLLIILMILTLMSVQNAFSKERREFYNGARALGMGGAQIAVVNDETALLVNPAGLGKLRDFYGTILDPELDFSNNLNSMYRKGPFSNPFSLGNIKNTLDSSRDTYYHARGQVFPSMVARNFGIGLFGSYIMDAEMNTAGDNIDAYYRSDMALALGYNFRFFDGRIKLGFNARLVNRIELDDSTIDPSGSLALKDLGATEGTAVATDVGLIMTAPWAWLPTISAVVRDMGNTTFDKANGVRMETTERPAMVPQDVDVAVAIFPIHSNKVRSAWTIEYQGLLTAKDETDKAKLIHAGMEMNFSDLFFLRLGYNQRYYTGGIEFASERFQFQFASYGEEIGDGTTHREDRRTVIKFAFRF